MVEVGGVAVGSDVNKLVALSFTFYFESLLRNPEFDPVENVLNFTWLAREKQEPLASRHLKHSYTSKVRASAHTYSHHNTYTSLLTTLLWISPF
jgi:hypothetical protein